LTIGEFANATQLTAKGLRLYDEHGILKPCVVDASTNYRYYGKDQISTGRLVRALRDMNLSLVQIREILESSSGDQAGRLRELLREAELRLARERAAYQTAVMMLRSDVARPSATIEEIELPEQLVAVFPLSSHRRALIDDALDMVDVKRAVLRADACWISLLEPLSDDDARLDLIVPVEAGTDTDDLTTRQLSRRRYATVPATRSSQSDGFTDCTDALFDWFDRKGVHAKGFPEIVIAIDGTAVGNGTVRWAFESPGDDGEHLD
jgi:DNA-binding transcriptional MerR regulator